MPCIACDYRTPSHGLLWRYATSTKNHGGQMQHKEGEGLEWSCWLTLYYPLKRSQSPRT